MGYYKKWETYYDKWLLYHGTRNPKSYDIYVPYKNYNIYVKFAEDNLNIINNNLIPYHYEHRYFNVYVIIDKKSDMQYEIKDTKKLIIKLSYYDMFEDGIKDRYDIDKLSDITQDEIKPIRQLLNSSKIFNFEKISEWAIRKCGF